MRFHYLAPMLTLGASMLAAPAIAQSDDETATTEAAQGERALPASTTRIICRRLPARVGSRIGGRNICQTAYEWDRMRAEVRASYEQAMAFQRF